MLFGIFIMPMGYMLSFFNLYDLIFTTIFCRKDKQLLCPTPAPPRPVNTVNTTAVRQKQAATAAIRSASGRSLGIYDLRFTIFPITWASARPRDVYMEVGRS